MKLYTPSEYKLFMHYTIEKGFVDVVDPMWIKSPDIQSVYKVYRDHFLKFGTVPDIIIYQGLLPNIELTLLKTILNKSDYDKKIVENTEWLDKYFDNWVYYCRLEDKLLSDIDIMRSGDINKIKEYMGYTSIKPSEEDITADFLKQTPTIPLEVYDNLPNLLKEMCSQFTDDRERDAFFTSEITVLSSLFPKVISLYFNSEVYSNLYSFVAAPAASGKQVIKYSRDTLSKIELDMITKYNQAVINFELNEKRGERPVAKHLVIPGNSSHASFIDLLNNNDGRGIIFETEADIIINTKKNDWGDYSADMRKAFQHEIISSSRKVTKEFITIYPKLSVCLSGTINQIIGLIGDQGAEDGIFSRFLYYVYDKDVNWISPYDVINKTKVFKEEFSSKIDELTNFYNTPNDTWFHLTTEQIDKFNIFFTQKLMTDLQFKDDGFKATSIRLGLITHRIMMLFTIIRVFDNYKPFDKTNDIICNDIDFDNAIKIIEVYRSHVELLYANLIHQQQIIIKNDNKEIKFKELPNLFTRPMLISKLDMSERTCDRFIHKLIKSGEVVKVNHFNYQKIINKEVVVKDE